MLKCKNRSLVENLEFFLKIIEMLDDSYPSNPLLIQNGITFFTSLTSLVTRTQLARLKIKGPLKRVDTL